MEIDGRLDSPSFHRNIAPITEALGEILGPGPGALLEIGSGSGQHAAHLARAMPGWTWWPSERGAEALTSIEAWRAEAGHPNLQAALTLDAAGDWVPLVRQAGLARAEAVFSANVIHISPWEVATGIVRGAAELLSPGGWLIFYGPFREGGRHTGEGNARFDESLRARDPAWGIRDLGDLAELARSHGFGPPEIRQMPANNRLAIFQR
ncbi:MAG: DUF938 domain-containing protein [Pseudomonadota bacterium]